jgi:membrane protein DedA with SNARE-associated domain
MNPVTYMPELSELFHQLIRNVNLFIDQPVYLFLLLFAASLLNTFFPPVPVEAATFAAAYLASNGHGSVPVIFLSTLSGMFLGGFALYYLSAIYGCAIIEKKPFNKLINRKSYEKGEAWFQKYGVWILFLGKIVPGMTFVAVICCGVLRLSSKKAALGIFFSNLLYFGAIVAGGLFAGDPLRSLVSRFF